MSSAFEKIPLGTISGWFAAIMTLAGGYVVANNIANNILDELGQFIAIEEQNDDTWMSEERKWIEDVGVKVDQNAAKLDLIQAQISTLNYDLGEHQGEHNIYNSMR